MKTNKPEIVTQAVQMMKDSQFNLTGIKVELEAQLGRGYGNDCNGCDDDSRICPDCDGNWEGGRCENDCDEGSIRCENECDDGNLDCERCEGDGHILRSDGTRSP